MMQNSIFPVEICGAMEMTTTDRRMPQK